MALNAKIRNVMGVESADFPINAITLVGGHNGAGKSTILDALACAVTGSVYARGLKSKKSTAALIRDGAPQGGVALVWEDGGVRVSWPAAEVETKGTPRALGTALGTGARSWMSLDAQKRPAEMAERLSLAPTIEHLRDFLREKNPDVQKETVEAVWQLVEDHGWDGAHGKAREQQTRLTGRWEQVADERWGSSKSLNWRPRLLDEENTYSIEAANERVASARARVEALLVAGAVGADELRRVKEGSARLGPAQAREEAARAKATEDDAAHERLVADLAAIHVPEVAGHTYPCPHCDRPVWLHRKAATDPYELRKPPEGLPAAELKKRRLARQAAEQAIEKVRASLTLATAEAAAAAEDVQRAKAATARLAELEAMPKVDADALASAREELARAEAVAKAVADWLTTKEIYAEWQRSQPVLEALAASGVRARRVAEAVSAFNERLALLSQTAGFPVVSMDADADAMLGGRPYPLLSESERWRVDLIVMLGLAAMEHPALVLVDRLDILHPQARPGVFMALREVGVPAVVACTAKEAGALPKLAAHGFGQTYWLEDGRLAPVA